MNQSDKENKFDEWLVSYQDDLVKIIGKHRYSNHELEHSEVLSEINRALIKDKEKLVNKKGVVTLSDFKKIAYSYARNYIKWTADGVSNKDKKYINLKVDRSAPSEDSPGQTLFELLCVTKGEEDPDFQKLNVNEKFKNLKKWIFDYSHFLSERQKIVLEYVMKGNTFDEIGDTLKITHQAISACVAEIHERISCYIKTESISKSETAIIRDGMCSVNYLFGAKRRENRCLTKGGKE